MSLPLSSGFLFGLVVNKQLSTTETNHCSCSLLTNYIYIYIQHITAAAENFLKLMNLNELVILVIMRGKNS